MMTNRVDFYPVDVGALHAGATSFSIYNSLAPIAEKYAAEIEAMFASEMAAGVLEPGTLEPATA